MMDESTWVAAMRANPTCVVVMAAFSDWLQEQGDPRWKPLAWLAANGCVGDTEIGYCSDRRGASPEEATARVTAAWYEASGIANMGFPDYHDVIANRMALLSHWSPEWLT